MQLAFSDETEATIQIWKAIMNIKTESRYPKYWT